MPLGAPETAMYVLGGLLAIYLLVIVVAAIVLGIVTLPAFYIILFGCQGILAIAQRTGIRLINYFGIMFRSITRNLLRASLT